MEIRHILVSTAEEAQEVRQELESGADFAELAKRKSTDQNTANQGGYLGYLERGRMPPGFEEVCFALKVGEISEPVKTGLGYHIMKLESRKEASVKEFYEVADDIRKKLVSGKQQREHQKWLHQLEREANIEIKAGFAEP